MTEQDSKDDETSNEENVEDQTEEGEDADTSQAAGQDNGEDGVDDRNATDPLDGLVGSCDQLFVVLECCQEVGVDSEDDGSTAEG